MTTPSVSRIRSPLVPKSNEQNVQSETKPGTQLRRKPSTNRLIDSSESDPSAHSSIFEALYFSANSSDSSNNRQEIWPMVSLKRGQFERSSIRPILVNENVSGEMTAVDFATRTIEDLLGSTPIIYGKGTALETIIEQKSHSTIGRTKSYDDLHHSLRQKSVDLAHTLNSKASFSLDDLSLIKNSYHEALSAIEKIPCTLRRPQDLYASPKKPIQPPPHRPPTPPGMPSWNEAQAEAVRRNRHHQHRLRAVSAPQQRNRFMRWVSQEISSIPTPSFGSNGAHTPPTQRFRAPRNTHGDIRNHPFNRAPVAQVKGLTLQSHVVPDAGTSDQHSSNVSRTRITRPVDISSTANTLAIIQRPHLRDKCSHVELDQSFTLPTTAMQGGYAPIMSQSPQASVILIGDAVQGPRGATVENQVCWKCRLEFIGGMTKYCLQKCLAFCCYVFCGIEWDEAEQMIVR